MHSTDIESPPPLPRVYMIIHTEGESCSDLGLSACSQRPSRPAEDGYNYSTLTVWKDRAAFSAWRASSAASRAHSKAAEAEPMFQGRPSPVMYEGVLAILSDKGA